MKKLLNILGTISLIPTIGVSALGASQAKDNYAKKELAEVIKATVVFGDETNTEPLVLNKILDLNPDSQVRSEDVQIQEFQPATVETNGSAVMVANDNSQFTGKVNLVILRLSKINLETVLKIKTVEGKEANTEPLVLNKILDLNPDSEVTLEDVQIKAGSFVPADGYNNGAAIIQAKPESKFVGEVPITINSIGKIHLKELITTTNLKKIKDLKEETILNKVVKLNSKVTKDMIKIVSGSITPTGAIIESALPDQYEGQVPVSFFTNKIPLSKLITNTIIFEYEANEQEAVFELTLAKNNLTGKLKREDVWLGYKPVYHWFDGLLFIVANDDSPYEDTVVITVIANEQKP